MACGPLLLFGIHLLSLYEGKHAKSVPVSAMFKVLAFIFELGNKFLRFFFS